MARDTSSRSAFYEVSRGIEVFYFRLDMQTATIRMISCIVMMISHCAANLEERSYDAAISEAIRREESRNNAGSR